MRPDSVSTFGRGLVGSLVLDFVGWLVHCSVGPFVRWLGLVSVSLGFYCWLVGPSVVVSLVVWLVGTLLRRFTGSLVRLFIGSLV